MGTGSTSCQNMCIWPVYTRVIDNMAHYIWTRCKYWASIFLHDNISQALCIVTVVLMSNLFQARCIETIVDYHLHTLL